MKKPSSQDEAREWLAAAAEFLQGVPYGSDALRHTAAAIQGYLNGSEKSLEGAFGLKSDRRRRASANRTEKNFQLAKKAISMRSLDTSRTWKEVCDAISREEKLQNLDERELRRWCATYRQEVIEALSVEWFGPGDDSA